MPDFSTTGQLNFSMPGDTQTILAQGWCVSERSNGNFTWWGNLLNKTGYIGIAEDSTGKAGYIQVGDQIYFLHPLSDRYNALVEIDRDTSLETDCLPSPQLPVDITTNPTNCDSIGDCKAVVSVLVLLTPEAEEFLGFDWSPLYLQLGLHSINFALLNSGVTGRTVRFVIEPYEFEFTGSPIIEDDLDTLLNDQDAFNIRTAKHADLMILLTDDRYPNVAGALKYFSTINPFFGIVTINNLMGPRFTFAHELGHAFWLNHNRTSNGGDENYEDDDVCNFGWRFPDQDNAEQRTLMAVLYKEDEQQGESRILNFSNPEVEFNGAPTGTSLNRNAHHVSRSMCEVDDYYVDDELEIDLIGPSVICDEPVTYTADIAKEPATGQPGSGPFTFHWWKDDDPEFNVFSGGDYGEYMGNAQSIQFYSPSNQIFWLLVFVCSTDGVCVNDVIKVESCEFFEGGEEESRKIYETPKEKQSFTIFPNPVTDHLFLRFSSPVSGPSDYTLSNSIGQVVIKGAFSSDNAEVFDIDLSKISLSSGLYYLTFCNGTFSGVRTFSVNR